MCNAVVAEKALELCEKYTDQPSVQVWDNDGYMVTLFRNEAGTIVHLLAKEYDTDIDHALDEMRYHRSRMNLVNKVEPVGISRALRLQAEGKPEVHLPFCDEPAQVETEAGCWRISLPEKCSYVIIRVPNTVEEKN